MWQWDAEKTGWQLRKDVNRKNDWWLEKWIWKLIPDMVKRAHFAELLNEVRSDSPAIQRADVVRDLGVLLLVSNNHAKPYQQGHRRIAERDQSRSSMLDRDKNHGQGISSDARCLNRPLGIGGALRLSVGPFVTSRYGTPWTQMLITCPVFPIRYYPRDSSFVVPTFMPYVLGNYLRGFQKRLAWVKPQPPYCLLICHYRKRAKKMASTAAYNLWDNHRYSIANFNFI